MTTIEEDKNNRYNIPCKYYLTGKIRKKKKKKNFFIPLKKKKRKL